jgi:hypothetical protein
MALFDSAIFDGLVFDTGEEETDTPDTPVIGGGRWTNISRLIGSWTRNGSTGQWTRRAGSTSNWS